MENKAFDFLLYCYFGIKSEEKIKSDIKDARIKCAFRAYLDLARTVEYTYSSSKLEDMQKKQASDEEKKVSEQFINCKNLTIKGINEKIVESMVVKTKLVDQADFDNWHKEICCKIIQEMKSAKDEYDVPLIKKEFTFGQAQKWLNMTLKYCWLLDLLPEEIEETYLHVPVDRFIIDAVKNDLKVKLDIMDESWSNWKDLSSYIEFQNEIKKVLNESETAIKWESHAWVDAAKEHSNK